MAPDSSFAAYNTTDDLSRISQMIAAVVGDPALEGMITRAFNNALGDNFRAHFGQPGRVDVTAPFGSSTIFGPQNVGQNFAMSMHDQAVSATMSQAASITEQLRREQLAEWYATSMNIAADDTAGQARISKFVNAPFSATGFLQGAVFNQLQPQQLMAGLEQGARYMGVGAVLAPMGDESASAAAERQVLLRQQAGAMAAGVQGDFLRNSENYAGLRGGDVGRVYAELSRTGGFNQALRDFDRYGGGADELEALQSETVRITQQAVQSVTAFRQIFRGSVTQALDQVNALMGVDVIQTFQGAEQGLVQRMAATGFATGHAPSQMQALAGGARQMALGAGVDPLGSIQTSILTAGLLDVHAGTGGLGNRFVNEPTFRQNMLRRVLGAQESGLARDISGAHTLLTEAGVDPSGFMAAAGDVGSLEDLVGVANQFMPGGGLSAFDLRSASFSEAAELSRAHGIGGIQALRFNAGVIQTTRRGILQRELSARGVGGAQLDAIMAQLTPEALGNNALTMDTIMGAVGDTPGINQTTFRGNMRRIFGEQARALGLGTNANEADAMLQAISNRDALSDIQGAARGNVELQQLFQNRGNAFGIQNLGVLIGSIRERQLEDPANAGKLNVGFGQIIRGLTGSTAASISAQDLSGFMGISQSLLDAMESPDATAMEKMGLNTAVSALFSQQIDGRMITPEERELMQEALGNQDLSMDERRTKLTEIAQKMHGDKIFDARVAMRESAFNTDLGRSASQGAKSRAAVKKLVSLNQIAEVGAKGDLRAGSDVFKATAGRLRDFAELRMAEGETDFNKIMQEFDALDSYDKGTKFDQASFMDMWKKEAQLNDNVSLGNDLQGMGGLIGIVTSIFQFLLDNKPNKEGGQVDNPEPSRAYGK